MSSIKSKADIPQWSKVAPSIIQHISREELINCIGNHWNNKGDIRRGILQTIKDKTEPPTETEPPSIETETETSTNTNNMYKTELPAETTSPNTETEVSTNANNMYKRWSENEVQTLRKAIEVEGEKFDIISSKHFHNKRTEAQCSHRWNKNLKSTLKKQSEWTKEEDGIILQQVSAVGGIDNE